MDPTFTVKENCQDATDKTNKSKLLFRRFLRDLFSESLNTAQLDSGRTKTVCKNL